MKKIPLILSLLWLPILLPADIGKVSQLIKQQHFEQALQSVDGLLEAQPREQQALFLRAITLQRLGRIDDAIATYQLLIREYPDLPEPYNNLAVLYAKQGQQEKARDVLVNALKTHRSYATAYENLGNIYARMAATAYNKALQLDKNKKPSQAALTLIETLPAQVKPVSIVSPAPASKKVVTNNDEVELIIDTVKGWSNAWSAQNSDAYLAYYADNFNPPNGNSREYWETQRRIRLKKPSFIRVSVQSPKVEILSEKSARLTFKQDYQSNKFQDAVQKTLLLEKVNGSWQILKEYISS